MPSDDEGPKPGGRDEGPKPGARDEGPKPGGRDEGPKPGGRGGAGDGSVFGGGAGWVVVAFISPISMNVPDLAVRMLQGGTPQTSDSPQVRALGRTAVLAQEQFRREQKELARLRQAARVANPPTTQSGAGARRPRKPEKQ